MRRAVLVAAVLLLVACGGAPRAGTAAHPRPATRGRVRPPAPARLGWSEGETFSGTVAFDEQDQGAVEDQLQFTASEEFEVLRVSGGTATVRVSVTGWRWQRNTSAVLTTSLPPKATFGVNATAEIVSGVDWPLPSQLPLPGLDVFASPSGPGAGWSRTDGEGVDLRYQPEPPASPGGATLTWSVVRPQFTRSGDPITVEGRAVVTVSSRYRAWGAGWWLRSTREQATFVRTTTSAAGTTQETGAVLETTTFSAPSR